MLLVGAGLLIRSFVMLQRVDLGLNPDNILVVRLPFPRGTYTTAPEKQRFFQQLLRGCTRFPASSRRPKSARCRPMAGSAPSSRSPAKRPSSSREGMFQLVSEGYAQTLGLRADARPHAVVRRRNRRARGRRHQRDADQDAISAPENPIGQHVRLECSRRSPTEGRQPALRDRRRDRRREEQRHPGSAESRSPGPLHDNRRLRAQDPGQDRGRARGAC